MDRIGNVLYKDAVVGTLAETPSGGTRFSYKEGWRQPIACTLPMTHQIHDWEYGVHPFFDNLSAEGRLKHQQARAVDLNPDDTFGLLLQYGHDCIGAVSLEKQDNPQPLEGFNSKTTGLLSNKTISGVQKKQLAYKEGKKFYPSLREDPGPYIAKFNNAEKNLNTLVLNEWRTLRLAKDILGNAQVTDFELGPLEGQEEYVLFVKRFDRTADQKKWRMEDFAQILNIPKVDKYKAAYEDIAEAIKKHSSRPVIDLSHFFKLVVFNCLVGNTDAHLKNFALVEQQDQTLRLAPAYDLLNTYAYASEGYSTELALEIRGKKRQWDTINAILLKGFGQSIGLTEKTIMNAFQDIKNRFKKSQYYQSTKENTFDDAKENYIQVIEESCARILET